MISGQAIVLAEVAANDAVDQVRVLFSDPVVPARGLDEGQVGYARAAAYFRETGDADLVVPATWSRTPLLDDGDVMPGAHVTSLGADEPGKAELTPRRPGCPGKTLHSPGPPTAKPATPASGASSTS